MKYTAPGPGRKGTGILYADSAPRGQGPKAGPRLYLARERGYSLRMIFVDRPDGRRLWRLKPLSAIMPYIMRGRNVPRDILISPSRIDRFYRENEDKFRMADQIRLRMIVIEKTRNPVDAMKLAKEITTKLDEGVSFAEMAAVYSDGSQAREGGLWGWVERKVLREDLADKAFSLPPGKRSEPIEKAEAVYIMLVEEARNAHVRPITEVRDEIERTLVTAERNRLQSQWLARLRKKAYIRLF